MSELQGSALRTLHAARDAVVLLRAGSAEPNAMHAAFLRVCDAAEATLRRLMRDDPGLPMELRLQALAPEELTAEEVVAGLRRRDRISLEMAASYHDLLTARRRIEGGAEVRHDDAELAVRVVERLEREATSAPQPRREDSPAVAHGEDAVGHRSLVARSVTRPSWVWGAAAVAALLLIALAVWWGGARRGSALEQGITLFRTGDFDRAAVFLERHTEAHPDDVTARLYLARIYRRTGRFEQAREELRAAIELAPRDAALQRELGFLLLDGGRADAAVGRFRSAIELDENSTEGWVGLVRALRASGQPAAAERVIARAPAEVRALLRTSPAS